MDALLKSFVIKTFDVIINRTFSENVDRINKVSKAGISFFLNLKIYKIILKNDKNFKILNITLKVI